MGLNGSFQDACDDLATRIQQEENEEGQGEEEGGGEEKENGG